MMLTKYELERVAYVRDYEAREMCAARKASTGVRYTHSRSLKVDRLGTRLHAVWRHDVHPMSTERTLGRLQGLSRY